MENFRYVNTKFWDDNYIATLDPSEKLVFLYFLTNPLTNLCGIYEISLKRIISDTGFNIDTVNLIIDRFNREGKIVYFKGWIFVKNHVKNQRYKGEKIEIAIKKELSRIPRDILAIFKDFKIPHPYTIDTLSIPHDKNDDPKSSEQNTKVQIDSNNSKILIPHDKKKEKEKGERKIGVVGGFAPPTPEEVFSYCQERGKKIDADRFVNFYESKGWYVGKNKMQSWRAAVRLWEQNSDNTLVDPIKNEILKLIDECDGNKEDAMHLFAEKNDMAVLKKYMKMFNTF